MTAFAAAVESGADGLELVHDLVDVAGVVGDVGPPPSQPLPSPSTLRLGLCLGLGLCLCCCLCCCNAPNY